MYETAHALMRRRPGSGVLIRIDSFWEQYAQVREDTTTGVVLRREAGTASRNVLLWGPCRGTSDCGGPRVDQDTQWLHGRGNHALDLLSTLVRGPDHCL